MWPGNFPAVAVVVAVAAAIRREKRNEVEVMVIGCGIEGEFRLRGER